MNPISPWAIAAAEFFANPGSPAIYQVERGIYNYNIHCTDDSLWVLAEWHNGGKIAFRTAYSPGNDLEITGQNEQDNVINFQLTSSIGKFSVDITFPAEGILRYTTSLKPANDTLIPFWPRDIIFPGKDKKGNASGGEILVRQIGTRSGMLYCHLTRPKAGALLYLQNLTALGNYNQQTDTSAGDTVSGEWPELGFSLPPSADKPLKAGKDVILSDAIVVLDNEIPAKEAGITQQYFDMLARVYIQLPKPNTNYQDWPKALDNGLEDLIKNPGCWSHVNGHSYLNAYVSDYATPPEIMVQLAVLLPLTDYEDWIGQKIETTKKIKELLPTFYDDKFKTIMRWLPAAADTLEGEEEQKEPLVMDSWYLHHPLLNLSRLALRGDKVATTLFLNSLEFAIKVAHKFDYDWPVFYKVDTLEVIKPETAPGKGGEKDVPGLYAHIMLQAYELTGKKRYLREAETAAKRLEGLGFEVFYQANNTAFSAGALLRLHKITGKKLYLDLSYLCLAGLFKNVRLWDCNYGYGKNFPSFFCLFPLNDAPYTAVYEEQEVFCAVHDYLKHAQGVDILPSVSLLLAEYVKYLVNRAIYYYPTMLPSDMLSKEPKMGEVDAKLWIALEDMYDGWEQSGQVGQEVYGAGNAFGILPRHYIRVADQEFMIYVDYPTSCIRHQKDKGVSFNTLGDKRFDATLMIVKMSDKKLPKVIVAVTNQDEPLKGTLTKDGHLQYVVGGNRHITVSWH
ncbi:hypothetical protein [Mucilaginibacter sp.]|uniref:hypothetical protein n=1 Tax=Mucilaginibacter sp. TaxID=1882438 RepID=UPI0035BBE714